MTETFFLESWRLRSRLAFDSTIEVKTVHLSTKEQVSVNRSRTVMPASRRERAAAAAARPGPASLASKLRYNLRRLRVPAGGSRNQYEHSSPTRRKPPGAVPGLALKPRTLLRSLMFPEKLSTRRWRRGLALHSGWEGNQSSLTTIPPPPTAASPASSRCSPTCEGRHDEQS